MFALQELPAQLTSQLSNTESAAAVAAATPSVQSLDSAVSVIAATADGGGVGGVLSSIATLGLGAAGASAYFMLNKGTAAAPKVWKQFNVPAM